MASIRRPPVVDLDGFRSENLVLRKRRKRKGREP